MDVKGISQAFMNGIPPSQQIQQYPNLRLLNLSQIDINVATHVFNTCLVNSQNLRWLCLDGTQITMSHSEILGAKFKALYVLHMRDWTKVIGLPSSICEISSLKELDLGRWLKLQTLPSSIGKLGNLQVLVLKECLELKELPESIGELVHLVEFDLSFCRRLKTPN
jgi:Leucine-rich repeat (LRR) protein